MRGKITWVEKHKYEPFCLLLDTFFTMRTQILYRCHRCAWNMRRFVECLYGGCLFSMVDDGSEVFNRVWYIFACNLHREQEYLLFSLLKNELHLLPEEQSLELSHNVKAILTWLSADELEKKDGQVKHRIFDGWKHPGYDVAEVFQRVVEKRLRLDLVDKEREILEQYFLERKDIPQHWCWPMNTKGEMWGKMNSCRMAITPDTSPEKESRVPKSEKRTATINRPLTPVKRKASEVDSIETIARCCVLQS